MSRGRPLAAGRPRPLLLTFIGLIGPSLCVAADTQGEAGGRSLVFVLLTFIIGAWVFPATTARVFNVFFADIFPYYTTN